MSHQDRRAAKNGHKGQLKIHENATKIAAPPPGCELSNDIEFLRWEQYARGRSIDDWLEHQLRELHRMIKIQTEIDQLQTKLNQEGHVIEDFRGVPKENPLFRMIDALTKQYLSIYRILGLNVTKSDMKTIMSAAREENKVRKHDDFKDNVALSLINGIKEG